MRRLGVISAAVAFASAVVLSSPAVADMLVPLDQPGTVVFNNGSGNVTNIGDGNSAAGRDNLVGSGHVAGAGHLVGLTAVSNNWVVRNNLDVSLTLASVSGVAGSPAVNSVIPAGGTSGRFTLIPGTTGVAVFRQTDNAAFQVTVNFGNNNSAACVENNFPQGVSCPSTYGTISIPNTLSINPGS
ncbi:hypothetical protein ACFV0H_04230 [Streptomyces erythrochromogenes]|uniref:Uncharacterized protein n=1 Tax=Streptomyces erythrochromogenes TaxID=285574 RepID=A0ABZ1QKI6_9ACTN|nr:hypothetical protein [Streptomyces erythrochromogenes]MCX5588733.1 hypothetical protein [Streptomyces erythrochromogenes]